MLLDVEKYLSIPFVDGGRPPDPGLDCWGLVMLVYKDLKHVDLPPYTRVNHTRITEVSHTIREQARLFRRVGGRRWYIHTKLDPDTYYKPPLIVVMRNHPVYYNHTAIWIGEDKILHTTPTQGVHVDRLTRPRLDRIEGWYDYV